MSVRVRFTVQTRWQRSDFVVRCHAGQWAIIEWRGSNIGQGCLTDINSVLQKVSAGKASPVHCSHSFSQRWCIQLSTGAGLNQSFFSFSVFFRVPQNLGIRREIELRSWRHRVRQEIANTDFRPSPPLRASIGVQTGRSDRPGDWQTMQGTRVYQGRYEK